LTAEHAARFGARNAMPKPFEVGVMATNLTVQASANAKRLRVEALYAVGVESRQGRGVMISLSRCQVSEIRMTPEIKTGRFTSDASGRLP
jgi:hypothetical protein